MAKKESFIEKLMYKYLHEFLSFLLSSLEGGIDESMKKFSNFIYLRKRWRIYMNSVIIMTAGVTLLAIGISAFIESFIIILKPGIIYILVGIIFILIALAYRKFK